MKEIKEVIVLDKVRITTYSDGSLKFESIDPSEKPEIISLKNLFSKITDWFKSLAIKPYAKIRDLADPFNDRDDPDAGSDGKSTIEIGIRGSF